MSRSTKKVAYGAFYLVLLILVLWGVFRALVPASSCGNGVRDGGETGIDCGGSCAACAAPEAGSLRMGKVEIFGGNGGRIALLGQIINASASRAASSFSYAFTLKDKDGRTLEITPRGTGSLHASERQYVFESEVAAPFSDIAGAELAVTDVVWRAASEMPRPDLSVSEVVTERGADGVRVRGTVRNESAFAARQIKVIAVLSDGVGTRIFAAQTIVDAVRGGASEPFPPIKFPVDEALARAVDPQATEVSVSSL